MLNINLWKRKRETGRDCNNRDMRKKESFITDLTMTFSCFNRKTTSRRFQTITTCKFNSTKYHQNINIKNIERTDEAHGKLNTRCQVRIDNFTDPSLNLIYLEIHPKHQIRYRSKIKCTDELLNYQTCSLNFVLNLKLNFHLLKQYSYLYAK